MEHRSIFESTLEHINSREKQLDESYKKEKAEIAELRRNLVSVNGNGRSHLAVAIAPAEDDNGHLARPGSKTAKAIQLLKRPRGATIKDLVSVTKWQPNSIRGFLSGVLGKKMGLQLKSTVGTDGER